METDLQLNIYSFYKLGTCRLWLWLSVDPKSLSAWRVPKWIPQDHAHGKIKDHVQFFLTHLPGCMYVPPWPLRAFLNICSRYSPAVLFQSRPSPRSMDFAKLIKQAPHKEFFLVESCAGVSMPFLCLSAVSAGLVWTRSVVPGANAALGGRKIHWCHAFSCIGARNWCLAVAEQGHGHLGHSRCVREVFVTGILP